MICKRCKENAKSAVAKYIDGEMVWGCNKCMTSQTNSLIPIKGCDTFNSHYDAQLGTFFESREQKSAYLKSKGLSQVSGTDSPRNTEGRGRLVCTKGQYQRGWDKV